jgi:sulfhydrogenase subunit beta (sulfur reductase)
MKTFAKSKINDVLDRLSADAKTYVPLNDGTSTRFGVWTENRKTDLALDIVNTLLPPKGIVFPQNEKMYDYKTEGQKTEITKTYAETEDTIVFGMRACDRKSLAALDQVFLTRDYVDSLYKARRDHLTVIGKACTKSGPFCFCSSMEVDQMGADGADVMLYENADEFGWEPVTEKGKELTAKLGELLTEKKDFKKPSAAECKLKIDVKGLPEKLSGLFEHPIWDEMAGRCVNCGACTYICPSCHCFDIQVNNHGEEGYRFRCWDSCMFLEYNMAAGGHNPRAGKRDRFRQRFLHKLEYFHERYGAYGCSGCGRCVAMCPNGNNIVSVVNRLKEVQANV